MAAVRSAVAAWREGLARLRRRLPGVREARPASPAASAPSLSQAPLDILAAKIVFSHVRNRQQLLGPPPTAFGQLDAAQTELLIHAAVLAALANGPVDEAAERRLRSAFSSVGLHAAADRDFLPEAIRRPPPLDVLLRQVRDPHVASLFYAASLLAADRHDGAGEAWLHFLARRLKLPAETLARLHSQFGAGGG